MKISTIFFLLIFLCGCALSKNQNAGTYPTGLIFPLETSGSCVFKGMNIGPVARQNGRLFITTRLGWLYCVNPQDGDVIWSHQADIPWDTPPYGGETGIYAVFRDNHIVKFDFRGAVLWDLEAVDPVSSGISEDSGVVYFGGESGRLHAVDAGNGKPLWSFPTGVAVRSTPRIFREHIFFGSDDATLYVLDRNGEEAGRFHAAGAIREAVAVEGRRVFFGSSDKFMSCADWTRGKMQWKMKSGGEIAAPMVLGEKNLYFTAGNNVLYCLNKANGTVKWWRKIPSQTSFAPVIIGDKVVVSSDSPRLTGFNKETGETAGQFTAPEEITSNPVWSDPHLLVSLYHDLHEEGELLFLKKAVYVKVDASPDSPQPANQNIDITAEAAGFYEPEYEFSLQRFVPLSFGWWPVLIMPADPSARVVQPFSEENSWAWFPEKTGAYVITVKTKDKKENAQNQIYYLILPLKEKTGKGDLS